MKMVPIKYTRYFLLLALYVLFCGSLSYGTEIPTLTGRVNDTAGMLSAATVQHLDSMLATLEQEDSTQIAVLTIPSLNGANLEEFSLKVVEKWRLGQKDLDNGALLLIAKNDRKIRIEVGYGLEGSLTDLISGRIISNIIRPQFRNGNFDQGVVDGVTAMISAVRGEFSEKDFSATHADNNGDLSGFFIFFSVFLINLGRILRKHRFIATVACGILAPLIGWLFWGPQLLILLILIPVGLLAGFLTSLIFTNMRASSVTTSGGFFSGGNSGGFSGGGFGGGGGGFGGGGSSGGW